MFRIFILTSVVCIFFLGAERSMGEESEVLVVKPALELRNPSVADQDDMCIWIHPTDKEKSTIITSDKTAGKIFVYGQDGSLLQTIADVGKPGNIDLRDNFPFGDARVSIVAYNERKNSQIHIYRIDAASGQLSRIDDGGINTGLNYGFTLYHSAKTGDFYGITVPDEGDGFVEQYRLSVNEDGRVSGELVRRWPIGQSEGCVTDDRSATLYIGEEDVGIWRVGAEPEEATPGVLVQSVGTHGLTADVEGLTILKSSAGGGYLMASSQGSNQYYIYELDEKNTFVKRFSVEGASETDGIDVLGTPFGARFPQGVFTLHNGTAPPHGVLVCDLRDLGLPQE